MTKQKWIVHENLIASKLQSRLDTHYYGDCEHLEIQMTTDMILSKARLGSVSALHILRLVTEYWNLLSE